MGQVPDRPDEIEVPLRPEDFFVSIPVSDFEAMSERLTFLEQELTNTKREIGALAVQNLELKEGLRKIAEAKRLVTAQQTALAFLDR